MKVFVTIGLTGGVVDSVKLTTDVYQASTDRDQADKDYGIDRQEDGSYEDEDNDVVQMEEELL
jgi:hypothetical protein